MKQYDRRFDLALRQDVKDWARTAGISEQEALLDVLEQRKALAAQVTAEGGNFNGHDEPTSAISDAAGDADAGGKLATTSR